MACCGSACRERRREPARRGLARGVEVYVTCQLQLAGKVLDPLIGKSMVLYFRKPETA